MHAFLRGVAMFLCLLPMWAQAAPSSSAWHGVVTKVSDGDTVWLQPEGDAVALKLRVQGIDAPESCQPGGAQATAALAAKVLNQRVEVQARERDGYGRWLGTLRLQGQDVGAWMVQHGHAWSYRYRHNAGPYVEEEAQARSQALGLFAQPNPQEPRWFRKEHGQCSP
jgi:micrococcal nuclease